MVNKCQISLIQNSWNRFQIQKNDPLTSFLYDLKHLTPFMSIPNIVLDAETVSST